MDGLDREDLARSTIEKALIACMVAGPMSIERVTELVTASDFTLPVHKRTFAIVCDMIESGAGVSPAAIESELTKAGLLADLGGHDGLLAMRKHGRVERFNIVFHAEQLRLHARKARLHKLLVTAAKELDGQVPDETIVERLEAELHALNAGGINQSEFTSAGDAAEMALGSIRHARETKTKIGLLTGIFELDEMTGGLMPGTVTVLAARPAVGKSCVGAEIAQRVAERGHQVMFANLEMSCEEMGQRFLSRLSGLPSNEMRSPEKLSDADMEMLSDAAERIRNFPLHFWGTTGKTIKQLWAAARRWQATHGLDFLVVDYMGLLQGSGSDIRERVTNVSQQIKAMARELRIPVLNLCQLNRDSERGGNGKIARPSLADLRDSGAIEQDADNVWFIIRDRDSTDCTLFVAKFRNGGTGDVPLMFDGPHSRVFTRSEINPSHNWNP